MAVVFDATPGGASANSFCTVARADDILTGMRKADALWVAATTASKEAHLIWATRMLVSCVAWSGGIASTTQALPLPRHGQVDRDGREYASNAIPKPAEEATAELAVFLLRRDRTKESGLLGQGITAASAGSLSVTVDPSQGQVDLIPSYIGTIIRDIGRIVAGGHGFGISRMTRA
jgi:hypothetical protein